MFGDNRSVVTSATLPHPTLSKRHKILAFHRIREAIATKIIDFHWIQSEYNLSDMLSKHWEHVKIFPMIQKLLITCGPIALIPRSATEEVSKSPKWSIHIYIRFKPPRILYPNYIQDSSHLHIHTQNYIHIYYYYMSSTITCHIPHKRGVTEVWHIAHFWMSYGRCATHGLPMGCSEGLSNW